MKKIITLLTLLMFFAQGYAQTNNNYSTDMRTRMIDLDDRANAFNLTEAEFKAIEAQAYDNTTFLPGSIFKDDQLAKKNVAMRYNANADEIEIKNSTKDGDYGAINKEAGVYAKIANETYVFVPFEGSNEKGGYFNVVTTGKTYDLYKKTTATFIPKYFAQNSYERDRSASFSKTVTYYLVDKGGSFYELPQGKSKLLKVMDAKKSEMKSFIDKNDLDVDKQRDLALIVDHFNEVL